MGAAHNDACLFCASPHPAGDSEQQPVALSDADKRSMGLEWDAKVPSHPTITATTPRRRGLGLGALQRQPTQQRESERVVNSLSSLRVTGLACEQHSESNNHLIVIGLPDEARTVNSTATTPRLTGADRLCSPAIAEMKRVRSRTSYFSIFQLLWCDTMYLRVRLTAMPRLAAKRSVQAMQDASFGCEALSVETQRADLGKPLSPRPSPRALATTPRTVKRCARVEKRTPLATITNAPRCDLAAQLQVD